MAFSIKNDEADQLVRDLVAVTGESLTEAVTIALRERLARQRRAVGGSRLDRIKRHAEAFARLPVLDDRSPDEILGYDQSGLPS
jgi:antitoxin VapB